MRNLFIVALFCVLVCGCEDNNKISREPVVVSPEVTVVTPVEKAVVPIKEPVKVAPIEFAAEVAPVTEPVGVFRAFTPAGDAFYKAALDGDVAAVKAGINKSIDVNSQNRDKHSAVMLAAFNGHTSVVKVLVDNGADVNKVDGNGRTALMFAASGDNPETVKLLLKNNAKIDAADSVENFTAIMFAAAEGQLEVVRILLESKADWKIVDIDGDTAKIFAKNNKHTKVVELIDAHAAKQSKE